MALTNKQKRYALTQARKWVNFKLKSEAPFKRELKSYFYQQSKRIARAMDIESIAPVLDKQYKRIVRNISGIKLKQDPESDYGLEDAILLLLSNRAISQAINIDKTTEKNFRRAMEIARQDLSNEGINFPALLTLSRIAANIFRAITRGRVGTIAVSETQMLTEKIKEIMHKISDDMMNDAIVNEDIALGERAAELSESMTAKEVAADIGKVPAGELFLAMNLIKKTWVTMGDSKVRPWHVEANWQTVPQTEPFLVMGELLMHPGDTSMGASLLNIIHCRCSLVYL